MNFPRASSEPDQKSINLADAKRKLGWDGPVRLNLASGTDARSHFYNLDIVKRWPNSPAPADLIWDARSNVIPFPSESVDEIVAGYLLLHVSREHHKPLIAEAFRVLKPGGRLLVDEVDMAAAMRRWLNDPRDASANEICFGEQGLLHGPELADYDKHCSGLTDELLTELLRDAGFVRISKLTLHAPAVWYQMSYEAFR